MSYEEKEERRYRVEQVIRCARDVVRHCGTSDGLGYHDVHWQRVIPLECALRCLDNFDKRIPE